MELYRAKRRQGLSACSSLCILINHGLTDPSPHVTTPFQFAELLNASSLPVFGSVVEVEASTFVDEVERVDSRVAVVVHLYETGVQVCNLRCRPFIEQASHFFPRARPPYA